MTERGMNLNRGVGTADIGAFADSLAESLNRQMRAAFQPEERKSLRRFSSTEVAELLRVSRLCCTNRLLIGLPLSPDRFILRPL